MTTCGYWWRRSCRRRRKNCPALRRGGGSPGTPWRGCSPCMPFARRMCSPGWGACPVLCGFLVSRSTSSPTNRSAGRTAYTSPWGTGRQDPQSGPENRSGEHRGDPCPLSGSGDRHGVPTESRQPLRPGDRAHRGRYPVVAGQVGDGFRPLFFV